MSLGGQPVALDGVSEDHRGAGVVDPVEGSVERVEVVHAEGADTLEQRLVVQLRLSALLVIEPGLLSSCDSHRAVSQKIPSGPMRTPPRRRLGASRVCWDRRPGTFRRKAGCRVHPPGSA